MSHLGHFPIIMFTIWLQLVPMLPNKLCQKVICFYLLKNSQFSYFFSFSILQLQFNSLLNEAIPVDSQRVFFHQLLPQNNCYSYKIEPFFFFFCKVNWTMSSFCIKLPVTFQYIQKTIVFVIMTQSKISSCLLLHFYLLLQHTFTDFSCSSHTRLESTRPFYLRGLEYDVCFA